MFDITNRRFLFRTRENRKIRYVDLTDCDFSPHSPARVFPLANDLSGDVHAAFVDYTYKINLDAINKAYADVKSLIRPLPASIRKSMARYPETTKRADLK